jgi:hypothetical protein
MGSQLFTKTNRISPDNNSSVSISLDVYQHAFAPFMTDHQTNSATTDINLQLHENIATASFTRQLAFGTLEEQQKKTLFDFDFFLKLGPLVFILLILTGFIYLRFKEVEIDDKLYQNWMKNCANESHTKSVHVHNG